MNNSFVSWKKDGMEVSTHYTVEYITDPQTWKIYQAGKHDAPWELFEQRTFNTVGEAMSFYLIRLYDQRTYVVNPVFEEIFLNGECIRESYIELNSTIKHNMALCMEMELLKQRDKLANQVDILEESNANMEKFIRIIGREDTYRQYLSLECR